VPWVNAGIRRSTSWTTGSGSRAGCSGCGASNTCIHTVHSARVPTPHNHSQHIQANTRRGFIQSVLLTMVIVMPETCWVNLLWLNIYTCVICWFFLLLLLQNVHTSYSSSKGERDGSQDEVRKHNITPNAH